jgi:mannose-1-phosphate guanylyltransferase
MLRQTIRRAERLMLPERLLTVITRPHLPYAQAELGDRPPDTMIVQPCNRETGRLVLLGVPPTQPEVDYSWIEVGAELGREQGEGLYQVRRLWEKPSLAQARIWCRQGYLWTMVVMRWVGVLVTLFHKLTPTLVDAFGRLRRVLGTPREADLLPEVYAQISAVNFSQAVLVRSTHRLAVLPTEGLYWSDWGSPQRLLLDLARFGSQAPAP